MTKPRGICRAAALALALLLPMRLGAQAQSTFSTAHESELQARIRAFRGPILLDTLAVWQEVSGDAPWVYARVRQILGALKVPHTQADSANGRIWNEGFVARGGKVAGKPTSVSLRCGTRLTGDNTDVLRVTVAYAVYVKPTTGGKTRLGMALIGQAKDLNGASSGGPAVHCVSTGKLESEITQFVRNSLPQ